MKTYMLNAGLMVAADGNYESKAITLEDFRRIARYAQRDGTLVSYIGYETTASILSAELGFEIPVNRDEAVIGDEAMLLIAKLKYRPPVGSKTTLDPAITDFEFRLVHYKPSMSEQKQLINLTSEFADVAAKLTSEFADVAAKLTDSAVQMLSCAAVGCSVSGDYTEAAKHLKTLETLSRDLWSDLQRLKGSHLQDTASVATDIVEDDDEAVTVPMEAVKDV